MIENAIESLRSGEVLLTNVDQLLGKSVMSSVEWKEFTDAWNELPIDQYMKDGGRYRQRRFSRFYLSTDTMNLRLKKHAPYSQPTHLNPLNGGTLRHFEPVLPETLSMTIFNEILKKVGAILAEVDQSLSWDINSYQNRTLAHDGVQGKPVPEGMHRDGVRYSVLLGIGRKNVTGAVSTIFDDQKNPVVSHLLQEGDILIFCDEDTYHDTTDISLKSPEFSQGTRDALVIEYYHNEGNPNQYHVS